MTYSDTFTLIQPTTMYDLYLDGAYQGRLLKSAAFDKMLAHTRGATDSWGADTRYSLYPYEGEATVIGTTGYDVPVAFVLDCVTACATNKIAAIKVVRELTSLGLKESKDVVEEGKPLVIPVTDMMASSIRQYVRDGIEQRTGVRLYTMNVDQYATLIASDTDVNIRMFPIQNTEEVR